MTEKCRLCIALHTNAIDRLVHILSWISIWLFVIAVELAWRIL